MLDRDTREEARREISTNRLRIEARWRNGLVGLPSIVGWCNSGTLSFSSSFENRDSRTGVVERGVRGLVGPPNVRRNSSLSEANLVMTSSNVVEFLWWSECATESGVGGGLSKFNCGGGAGGGWEGGTLLVFS